MRGLAADNLAENGVAHCAPERNEKTRWLKVWLTCVAFYYPISWASQSLLFALPALIRVALFGYRLEHFQLTRIGAFASSIPPTVLTAQQPSPTRPDPFSLWITLPLVLVATIIIALLSRKWLALSGLGIAMLGQVALQPWLGSLFGLRRMTPEGLIASMIFFGTLCFGLRKMLFGWHPLGYWGRVAILFAGFVLPRMLGWPWLGLTHYFRISSYALFLLSPGAAASLLVSLRPASLLQRETQAGGWKLVGWGAATSLLLAIAVPRVELAIQQTRLDANRAAMAAYPKIPADLPYPKLFFQKGVNFTAEFPDPYASEGARRMLEALPQYGVNAVALVPYGWSRRNLPEVRIGGGPESWESDEGIEELSRVAHARGIKVFLKPALWTGQGYAGDLEFSSAEDRAKWFAEYRAFLEHYAQLAKLIHADLFCVGGEFVKLSSYSSEWRKLITRVREFYPGPLVYAANFGTEFESIAFWDALDFIGLQEYYPLPDDLSTSAVVQRVEAVQKKFQRPVIFTEAGFSSYEKPNRKPWEASGHKLSLDDQARSYAAIFRAFFDKPWFEGVYWWKIGTNGYGGPQDGSHTPWGKPAMEVIKRWYLDGGR